MYIERAQVEEGFLNGLDLKLSPGLNTVIGAKGAGKSSLIELIRFCLNAKGYTAEASRRSYDHAVDVLKGGQVTVTLRDGDERFVVRDPLIVFCGYLLGIVKVHVAKSLGYGSVREKFNAFIMCMVHTGGEADV